MLSSPFEVAVSRIGVPHSGRVTFSRNITTQRIKLVSACRDCNRIGLYGGTEFLLFYARCERIEIFHDAFKKLRKVIARYSLN